MVLITDIETSVQTTIAIFHINADKISQILRKSLTAQARCVRCGIGKKVVSSKSAFAYKI